MLIVVWVRGCVGEGVVVSDVGEERERSREEIRSVNYTRRSESSYLSLEA